MGLADLWKHLPCDVWEDVPNSEMRGKTLAIDGQVWLYECSREVGPNAHPRSFLIGFHNRCKRLLDYGIQPFIIFDSYQDEKMPQFSNGHAAKVVPEVCWDRECRIPKVDESARGRYGRNYFTPNAVSRVLQLLDCMGIRYYKNFFVDNEAAACYLEDTDQVSGFVSPDMDFFLYGGRTLYQLFFTEHGSYYKNAKRLRVDRLLTTYGLNRTRLVALGMLMGCDYSPKQITGIGIVTALEAVSEFSLSEDDHPCTILERFRAYVQQETPQRATDSSAKKKLISLEPSLISTFAECVNAYMWPHLGSIPYDPPKAAGLLDPGKVKEMLSMRSLKNTPDSDALSDSSVEVLEDRRKENGGGSMGQSSTKSSKKMSSSSSSMGGDSYASFRRGPKRRLGPVVVPCSQQDAARWSKREWQAIVAMQSNTIYAFNKDVQATMDEAKRQQQQQANLASKRRTSNASDSPARKRKLMTA